MADLTWARPYDVMIAPDGLNCGGAAYNSLALSADWCYFTSPRLGLRSGLFNWWLSVTIVVFMYLTALSATKAKSTWKQSVPFYVGVCLLAELIVITPGYVVNLATNLPYRLSADLLGGIFAMAGAILYYYFGYLRVCAMNHPAQIYLQYIIPVAGVARIVLYCLYMFFEDAFWISNYAFYQGYDNYYAVWVPLAFRILSAFFGLDLVNILIDAFVAYVILSRKKNLSSMMSSSAKSGSSSGTRTEHVNTDINRSLIIICLMATISIIHTTFLFNQMDLLYFYYPIFYSIRFALAELFNSSFTNAIFDQKY